MLTQKDFLSEMEEQRKLTEAVLDRLLVAKRFLDKIRFSPAAQPDRVTLARHILTAHDAAELAIAAITQHLKKRPKPPANLMIYLDAVKQTHPGEDVEGYGFFVDLNQARIAIKHFGNFPDTRQWYRVGEQVWQYVSVWCQKYLGLSLQDLDESALITDPIVKGYYDHAVDAFRAENYQGTFELLAGAAKALFDNNKALSGFSVGLPRAEDAIKLAAFGVQANNYLALQEFLPGAYYNKENKLVVKWEQGKYGHPANWNKSTAEFSLKTFVDVALCIQDADRIPGAIDFDLIYEHQITALADGVEIFEETSGLMRMAGQQKRVVRTLQKGEVLRGKVSPKESDFVRILRGGSEEKALLKFSNFEIPLFGYIEKDKVKVTCVPKDNSVVRKYFPDLPELEYEP